MPSIIPDQQDADWYGGSGSGYGWGTMLFPDDQNPNGQAGDPLLNDQLWNNLPEYGNPFWGPLNTPGNVTIGDPSMQIPDDPFNADAIGGYLNYDVGQNSSGAPGHGSLGPDNPTNYGSGSGGGLFGSGLDVGIPGLISIGGVGADLTSGALIGGGLLGLGGTMGGIFGGGTGGSGGGSGSVPDATNPTVIPPVITPGATEQTPVANNDTITVAPSQGPVHGPALGDAPANPVTLPPYVPPIISAPNTGLPTPGPVSPEGLSNASTTVPIPVTPTTPPVQGPVQGETPVNPTTLPPYVAPVTPITNPSGEGLSGSPTTIPAIPGLSNGGEGGAVTNPTTLPVVPITPVTPAGGGGSGGSTTPIPTTTMPTLPVDRNLLREGTQTNSDLSSILQGIFGNYASQAGQYGTQDLTNFSNLLSGVGANNASLTGLANQQTAASNTALRTGNVNDASNLGGQALATLRNLNPNMYGALDQAQSQSQRGPSDIQTTLEQQARDQLALGGSLSPEEQRAAQQSAREAWGARGLINSNGAVGAEILNRDSLSRQRLAERQQFAQGVDTTGFNQRQTGYGNTLSNAALQSQYGFNPFTTITSANTQNQGTNQNLFGNTAGFSSGAYGNQNAQQLANPFSPYAQDVYSTNYNAGNDRFIAAGNNAAGLAGASSAVTGNLANSFFKALGSYFGASGTCWVARSVFGAENPKWLQFREWLLNHAPKWFMKLYVKHGEKFAVWLDKNPWLKPAIRVWMEGRIRSMNTLNTQPAY